MTITDAYNRVLKCCGKKVFSAGDDSVTSEKIMDGKYIIDRYRE